MEGGAGAEEVLVMKGFSYISAETRTQGKRAMSISDISRTHNLARGKWEIFVVKKPALSTSASQIVMFHESLGDPVKIQLPMSHPRDSKSEDQGGD